MKRSDSSMLSNAPFKRVNLLGENNISIWGNPGIGTNVGLAQETGTNMMGRRMFPQDEMTGITQSGIGGTGVSGSILQSNRPY